MNWKSGNERYRIDGASDFTFQSWFCLALLRLCIAFRSPMRFNPLLVSINDSSFSNYTAALADISLFHVDVDFEYTRVFYDFMSCAVCVRVYAVCSICWWRTRIDSKCFWDMALSCYMSTTFLLIAEVRSFVFTLQMKCQTTFASTKERKKN